MTGNGVVVLVAVGTLMARTAAGQLPPVDTASLANGPGSRMVTLYEKTVFKVDVLTLEVHFGDPVAIELHRLAASEPRNDALRDSIATVAMAAQDVWARMTFHRNVKLTQFLDGLGRNARRAREADVIDEETYRMVLREVRGWYASLANRNIRDGDQMIYRIRGDTLRTVVRDVEGQVYVDQTDVGRGNVLSVLGGYFAPRSDFRKGLIESLFSS